MPARRRGMPWVLAIAVLILVAFATHVPRVCHDASESTPALSEVSTVAPAVLDVPDPCDDAAAHLGTCAVFPSRLDVTDPAPTRLAIAPITLGRPPAGGPVTAGTPGTPRPPMGLAVANLAVTRI